MKREIKQKRETDILTISMPAKMPDETVEVGPDTPYEKWMVPKPQYTKPAKPRKARKPKSYNTVLAVSMDGSEAVVATVDDDHPFGLDEPRVVKRPSPNPSKPVNPTPELNETERQMALSQLYGIVLGLRRDTTDMKHIHHLFRILGLDSVWM